jgi:cytochrome d ubiquinol oxidase subunit I
VVTHPALLAAGAIPARSQMASTLAFHIILACFGIAFPAVVMTAEWIGIRRREPAALLLARRWSKVMALLFAVGAVSGTVLSYEMGLLWPGLMGRFGGAIGIPFSVEDVFFFLEAIFTGIYLYGWRRLAGWAHWWTGMPIVIAGIAGAMSVVAANSWMNQPGGFTLRHGRITAVNPWSVYFNHATPYEVPHMVLAAYMVTGFVIAGVYAVGMLRGRRNRYHELGFKIPFWFGAILAPVQVVVGHVAGVQIASQQPQKFAAMEYVVHTQRGATEYLGGFYYHGQVYLSLSVPKLDSILVGFSPSTKVIGWDSVPPRLRAPLPDLIHLSFDGMVVLGLGLLALGAWYGWVWWFHRRLPRSHWFLPLASVSGLAAIAAMEMGWIVTEVGRQPWIVYHVLLTQNAVTPATAVPVTLGVILGFYAVVTVVTVGVPWRMGQRWRREDAELEEQESVPYGPPAGQVSSR